jgi:hypothetical protein
MQQALITASSFERRRATARAEAIKKCTQIPHFVLPHQAAKVFLITAIYHGNGQKQNQQTRLRSILMRLFYRCIHGEDIIDFRDRPELYVRC